MVDETSDAINLDLNLGPVPEPAVDSGPNEAVNLDDWIDGSVRLRASQRRRWRQLHIMPQTQSISMELNQLLANSVHGNMLQVGEGSVAVEAKTEEVPNTCGNTGVTVDATSEKKEDDEKEDRNNGSFFDCNICLELACDPVVTCCGHLFCWSCLYRWLHVHSDDKECPVCKGEVTTKNVTPIYGRGNNNRESEEDSNLKIPPRPQARRVESLRQTIQRHPLAFPVEEMIRQLGSRIDLRGIVQPNETNVRESAERTMLNRYLTFRRLRREQNLGARPDEVVDLTENNSGDNQRGRLQSVFLRRTHRANHTSLSSALSSSERLAEAYPHSHHTGRNQEQPASVDDRDSFSSIGAVINSESQMDTAVEIDSLVSLSASASRRRTDSSRVSDVDSGDSRGPRRRRLS